MKINFGVIGTNVITQTLLQNGFWRPGKMQKGFASGAYIPALGKKPLILPENMEQILPLTVWKTWLPVRR